MSPLRSSWCHAAFEDIRKLKLTLLSDFEPKGADDASLGRYASLAGVDGKKVLQDLAEGRYEEAVRESFMNGTPTLFIDGIRYDGPRDEETLVAEAAGRAP